MGPTLNVSLLHSVLSTVYKYCVVTCAFAALQFVTTPSDMIIAPGSEHILRCTVTPPTANLIVWYQDDAKVNLSGGRVTTRHGGTELVITGVQRSDSGRYTCEASSSEGSLRSLGATIQVACK